MSEVNQDLREHVTSIGFALTLTKRQIQTLVLMHHFGGFNKLHAFRTKTGLLGDNYVSTAKSLTRRGLFMQENMSRISNAGRLVCELLMDAGIYQDVLDNLGINEDGEAA